MSLKSSPEKSSSENRACVPSLPPVAAQILWSLSTFERRTPAASAVRGRLAREKSVCFAAPGSRTAPRRSAPATVECSQFTPVRTAPRKSAPDASQCARSAPSKSAPTSLVSRRSQFLRLALRKMESLKSAFSSAAPSSFASHRLARCTEALARSTIVFVYWASPSSSKCANAPARRSAP